ncbi:hypothetical protein LB312_10460 [Bacillus tropicus]|uniref:sunset domain-containing protein n=1 Tax=Bacillus tropicus TaxID=2026188 RepID=UPI001E37791E|nr:hypothetical protein [Bacillus tropicus]MCC1487690.1 hypothetical protein [Bacillus tropicus]
MNRQLIKEKLNKVDTLLSGIQVQSNTEYERILKIMDDEKNKNEYKKLIFNGLIQHFSILGLLNIKNALTSLSYKEIRKEYQSEDWTNRFFSSNFFEKNAIYFLHSVINKIATLIKFRYCKPDKYISANLAHIHKQAKKNEEYKKQPIYTKVSQLIGDNNYRLLGEFRSHIDHSLDLRYLKKEISHIDFFFLISITHEIIEFIYSEHLISHLDISDNDIEMYKVKNLNPINLEPLRMQEIVYKISEYNQRDFELLNTINNYFDLIIPFVSSHKNINENQEGMISMLIAILSDLIYRIHESNRAFQYFFLLYLVENKEDYLPIEIIKIINDKDYAYFMNVSLLRLYSVYDKFGLFFSRIYPMPKDKTYFKQVTEWILNNIDYNPTLVTLLQNIKNTPEYKAMDVFRQQFTHGFDLSIKQNEGTTFSDEYFFIFLFRNIENTLDLIEYISYEFFPYLIEQTINISTDETEEFLSLINRIINHNNSYMNNQFKNYQKRPSPNRKIKGNANTKIYHVPGGRYYYSLHNNIIWFCSEIDAQAAGFVKSKR